MNSLKRSTSTVLQHIPSLPTNYSFILKTWFSGDTLTQGLDLLQKERVSFFSFQRRFAGLILDDNTLVSLQMAKGSGNHRFVFRDGSCSLCGWQQGGANCRHVAALALLCLQKQGETLHPLADLFPLTPWFTIGKYLHEQTNMRRNIALHLQQEGDHWLLCGASENGLDLRIFLTFEAVQELAGLFPIINKALPEASTAGDTCAERQTLLDKIAGLAASKNEASLNHSGMKSKQQKLDASLWMYLARLLFLHLPAESLGIKQEQNHGTYTLYYEKKDVPLFALSLARNHTWELLSSLSLPDIPVSIESAQQFSRVSFVEDSADIQVDHCCRLQNGTEYCMADIETNNYGTRYQIDDTIFTLQAIPAEKRLGKQPKGQLSLFAVPCKSETDEKHGFTVQEKDVSRFVKDNRDKLLCRCHHVSPEILNMHVVSMPEKLIIDQYEEESEWCYLAGWYDMGNRKIRLDELLSAANAGKTLLPGETWFDIKDSPLSWFHELGPERVQEQDGRIKMRRGEFLALGSQIAKIHNQAPQQSGTLAAFLQSDQEPRQLNNSAAKHLRSYQKHGCNWLYQLQHYQLGGILADDMGLGKTHQALALIDLLAGNKRQFLIVCPAAVLYHWPEKQKQFFPQLNLSVYHGSGRDLTKARQSQIIVTSYGVMRQDAEQFAECNFKLLLFDEMHVLKNRKTATYAAVSQLNAESVIGLTGTPVENSVRELETLLCLCLPEIFSAAPIRQQFKTADSKEQRLQLQRLVSPFILRRTRSQVLPELPKCSEDIRSCELSPDQVGAYRQAADQASDIVDELLEEKKSNFTTILATIIRLKQICNHLCQLEQCTDYTRYGSGKWDEFTRLVRQCIHSELKVVVFSQFTTMLDIIETWLNDEKIGFVTIRGNVAAKERNRRIKRFNTGKKCKICCASLLAGGTGIDLTGAQVVIHYDRWWNPAKEEQATARVHRMGQKHPVQVYKLVTAGTLEEKIHRMIEKKRALAADLVVEDDGSVLKTLSREELAGLFRY